MYRHFLVVSVCLCICGFSRASTAEAATYTVDRTDDTAAATGCVDATLNDCSLRGAIIKANAGAGGDVIIVPASTTPYDITIPNGAEGFGNTANDATVGDIDITKPMTITGGGAGNTTVRVTGTGNDRIFHIPTDTVPASTGTVEISGLTLTGGKPGVNGHGGAIMVFSGGGKNNLILSNCNIKDNTADKGGGGLAFENSADLTITSSTFSGNSAADRGGGIFLELATGTGTITNSTISGNSDTGDGTTNTGGGGIELGTGTLTITNSTIVGNTVTPAGSIGGGIMSVDGGAGHTIKLKNSILASNTVAGSAQNCGLAPGAATPVSQGHNLSGDASCASSFLTSASDQNSMAGTIVDATLADNGGTTPTHTLPSGSPAIDAGDDSGAPATDQRGFTRPADGNGDGTATADIGAVEVGCGNGNVETGEQCDDGNLTNGDGCSSTCQIETSDGTSICGNGTIEGTEECDDSNTTAGDGCSATCTNEGTPACGDGILQTGEVCDDGNTVSGDGCSSTCQTEPASNSGGGCSLLPIKGAFHVRPEREKRMIQEP